MPNEVDRYVVPAAVTIAGITQLVNFTKAVGQAMEKYKVKPRETDGPSAFMIKSGAHQKTVEFYPVSLASLWLGSVFLHPVPSSLLYAGYLYGCQKYFAAHDEDADTRGYGLKISTYSLLGLVLLSIIGVGHRAVRYFHGTDIFKVIHDRCSQ